MPRLHHLNVSHNSLSELLDETFVHNEELMTLDISYNHFEGFNEFSFRGLEVLEVCAVQTLLSLSYQSSSDQINLRLLSLPLSLRFSTQVTMR